MKIIPLHNNYKKLITALSKNDRKAQKKLFELFAPKMLGVCRRYINQDELAEEVMLLGFMKVFSNIAYFRDDGSFEGWIRRIMVNESISFLRKEKSQKYSSQTEIENSMNHAVYIEDQFAVEEIQKLIDTMPQGYRTVFILYCIEGYRHSEIAEMLKITENTSKSQLFKARKHLQQLVENLNVSGYGYQ